MSTTSGGQPPDDSDATPSPAADSAPASETDDPTPPRSQPAGTPAAAQPAAGGQAPSGSNGMAVAALVLGIVALVFGFIPFLGAFIAIPLGIVAIVLGALGRGESKRIGSGAGLATAGLITGSFGIVIALLWGLLLAGVLFTEVEYDVGDIIGDVQEIEPFRDAPTDEGPGG